MIYLMFNTCFVGYSFGFCIEAFDFFQINPFRGSKELISDPLLLPRGPAICM